MKHSSLLIGRALGCLTAALVLAGCGGGGGASPSPSAAPVCTLPAGVQVALVNPAPNNSNVSTANSASGDSGQTIVLATNGALTGAYGIEAVSSAGVVATGNEFLTQTTAAAAAVPPPFVASNYYEASGIFLSASTLYTVEVIDPTAGCSPLTTGETFTTGS